MSDVKSGLFCSTEGSTMLYVCSWTDGPVSCLQWQINHTGTLCSATTNKSTVWCDVSEAHVVILVRLLGRTMAPWTGPEGGLEQGQQVGGSQGQPGSHRCVEKRSRRRHSGGKPVLFDSATPCLHLVADQEHHLLSFLVCLGQLWDRFCGQKWQVPAAGEGRGLGHLNSPPEEPSSRACQGEACCVMMMDIWSYVLTLTTDNTHQQHTHQVLRFLTCSCCSLDIPMDSLFIHF